MIAISVGPNYRLVDALRAFFLLLQPWKWHNGKSVGELEKNISNFYGTKAYTINSARWGIYLLLKSLNLPPGSEILIQAFTCVSVPGPIIWNNLKPVYVDIDSGRLTIDPQDLEKKISEKSRVLIVQHTFGFSAEMDKIMEIAKKHNLIVIEDCAHTIGGFYKEKMLGTIGDAAVISFGRDKAISGVFGGAVIVNNRDLFSGVSQEISVLERNSTGWVMQQLMHPILFVTLIKPLYFLLGIGKILLVSAQRIGILSKAITKNEKSAGFPVFGCSKISNALADLALVQFSALPKFNQKRRDIVDEYDASLEISKEDRQLIFREDKIFPLRYAIYIENALELRNFAKRKKIILGDWYEVIAPKDSDLQAVQYDNGSCKTAEKIAKKIVNLPTCPGMSRRDIKKVIKVVNMFMNKQK